MQFFGIKKMKNFFKWFWIQSLTFALPFELHTQSFFALVIFQTGPCNFALRSASDSDLPIYISHIAGMTGTCHHTWLVSWNRVSLTFMPGLASNHYLPNLYILSKWNYKCALPHLVLNNTILTLELESGSLKPTKRKEIFPCQIAFTYS
jgi:hypothetical protein